MSTTRPDPSFGRFLELSVPAPDIQASLEFYRRLGFSELPVNDIRRHYYSVVTDGALLIGLHGGGIEEAALAFVRPGLAAWARRFRDGGGDLALARLAEDEFIEVLLHGPDGHGVLLLEARTFSAAQVGDLPAALPGRAAEISLRCPDPASSLGFWITGGLATLPADPEDAEVVGLDLVSGGPRLGLRHPLPWAGPVLRYRTPVRELSRQLEERDIPARRQGDTLVLTAPEGTRLVVTG
jgi:catechol 2,3-dioxygenase-like lactoylglutathione lyase family enzyme